MICPHCKGFIDTHVVGGRKGGRVRSLAKARSARQNGMRKWVNEKTMKPAQIREYLSCYGKEFNSELVQCTKRCGFRFSCKKLTFQSFHKIG